MEYNKLYMGHWWLPGAEELKVPGNFIYDSKSQSYRLRLLEKLKGHDNKFHLFRDYSMIIGLAKDDESNKDFSFKLLDGFSTKIGPGSYYEVVVNEFLASPGTELTENIFFDSFYLKVTYLDEWFANSGFNISKHSETKFGYQLEYHQPEDILLYQSREFEIKGIFQATINYPLYTDLKAGQSAYILVQYKRPQNLTDIKKKALEIKNLFCLAIGLPLKFENFQLENRRISPYKFNFYQEDRNKNLARRNIRSFSMPINYKDHKLKLPQIFKSWFSLQENFVLPVLNYFSVVNDRRGFEEDQFLNLVIGIETYQRKKFPDFKNKRGSKFLKIRERVLLEIKNKNDHQWLSKHLKKTTPNTLKDRFHSVLDIYTVSLKDLIVDQKKFVDHVVETRHHLVHEEVESLHLVLKGGENLYIMNSILKIILEAIFLNELGFEHDSINQKLKKNQYNFQAFSDETF